MAAQDERDRDGSMSDVYISFPLPICCGECPFKLHGKPECAVTNENLGAWAWKMRGKECPLVEVKYETGIDTNDHPTGE